jgi:hypothetical protein
MRYRPFGKTGLLVSELCLGTMTFGGKGFWEAIGTLGAKEVEATIGGALDAGVNFIDSAAPSARWGVLASSSSWPPRSAGAPVPVRTRSASRARTSWRRSTRA